MSRLKEVKDIYEQVTKDVVKNADEWQSYLNFMAKIYKHSFKSALLIYAQRPDATFVCDMETWNKRVGRRVNRGTKSIAVFHESSRGLNHLFDVSDTNGEPQTYPALRQLKEETVPLLFGNLSEEHDVFGSKIAYDTYEIIDKMIHDELKISETNRDNEEHIKLVTESVKFVVCARLGIISNQIISAPSGTDFSAIVNYNSNRDLVELGQSIQQTSYNILMQIERKMRELESGINNKTVIIPEQKNEQLTEQFHENITQPEPPQSGFLIDKNTEIADIQENEQQETKINTEIPVAKIEQTEKIDYRYSPEDGIGSGGAKLKFRNNVDAIKTLKAIENENRFATADEQKILCKYSGWGGIPQAFDENNSAWANEYRELKNLLDTPEYESARASTPNAHYTSPTVIEAIYNALNKFGFKSGNILEPAMGVGNFFAMLPDNMKDSKLYGVELDSISGRIARQLHQNANIRIQGFETTDYPDNFFDAAIGNVPFGDYKIFDREYNKYNLNIHDYFFLKTLDKVRPNGIVAFITSHGTLDKENETVRKMIAERADLIGAIRLPNDAFKQIANTDVTTDIIFLQKREQATVSEPDWLKVGETKSGVPVNQYYIDNPEMLLGEMIFDNKMFGEKSNYTGLKAFENMNLAEELKHATDNLFASVTEYENFERDENDDSLNRIPADPDVRNYTFNFVGEDLYYRENSYMKKCEQTGKTLERIKGMCAIRDVTREIINMQLEGCSENDLKLPQMTLNNLYDDFVKKHGYITNRANNSAFRGDADYPLISSLEIIDDDGNIKKADMFTKQTIRPYIPVTSVDTAADALKVSLTERGSVDINFMAKLYDTGRDESGAHDVIVEELRGLIYLNPQSGKYETADEYLSGKVRDKLNIAKVYAENNPAYIENVEALEKVQPIDLTASEIDVKIGVPWIELSDYNRFMYETFDTPSWRQKPKDFNLSGQIETDYNRYTDTWSVTNKRAERSSVKVNETYGTSRMNAYEIMEDTLNMRSAAVRDRIENPDGTYYYKLNQKETAIAREKQALIKEEFKNWIFADPDRRKKYVDFYNQTYNNIRLREYDGSHLTFAGMNPDIEMRPNQLNAVARVLYGNTSTLLAHSVGAGKSFIMAASCMELRRLGLAKKAMFVVPNHLTEQMGSEFLRLYPSAKILVATKKDFEKQNRLRFVSRIATGDYDAVIVGFSQFEKIALSKERQEKSINDQIDELTCAIDEMKYKSGEKWAVKQMEKFKKNLETQLKILADDSKKDDLIEFEGLGVDYMFVDEAHYYKNCAVFSKMRNVAGISQSSAKKATDMLMKCDYLQEINNGKGVIFASGTPVYTL